MTPTGSAQPLPGINDQNLASRIRVLRITHDKGWHNDDDPGTSAPGWVRTVNLNGGDYNDDLTISDTPGVTWVANFSGTSISLYAPKESGAGSVEIQIDEAPPTTVSLSNAGTRMPQQLVFEETGLAAGNHVLSVTHESGGQVAVDAIVME